MKKMMLKILASIFQNVGVGFMVGGCINTLNATSNGNTIIIAIGIVATIVSVIIEIVLKEKS